MRTCTSSIVCQKSTEKKLRVSSPENNVGDVTIDGVVVPGANIIDLINGAMRDRKRSMPVGHLQFAAALCNTAIPREFIGNKCVWREFTNIPLTHSQSASASSGGETYRTPSHSQSTSASSGGETDWF